MGDVEGGSVSKSEEMIEPPPQRRVWSLVFAFLTVLGPPALYALVLSIMTFSGDASAHGMGSGQAYLYTFGGSLLVLVLLTLGLGFREIVTNRHGFPIRSVLAISIVVVDVVGVIVYLLSS